MVYINSAATLQDYLGVSDTVLTDAAAEEIIEQVEDLLDKLLGWIPKDQTTGRKIVESEVYAWQWNHLTRAALLAAKNIYTYPELQQSLFADSERSPDFSRSGIGKSKTPENTIGQAAMLALNASGLRRLTA